MEKRGAKTHSTRLGEFVPGTAFILLTISKPTTPEITSKSSVVIESVVQLIVFSKSKYAIAWNTRMVEDLIHIIQRPVVIEINWMWDVDRFITMMQSNSRRPHFWKHGMSHLVRFLVCHIEKASG